MDRVRILHWGFFINPREGTGTHLIESDNEGTVCCAGLDELVSHVLTCAARAAMVIDTVHRNSRHSQRVEYALSTRGVAKK